MGSGFDWCVNVRRSVRASGGMWGYKRGYISAIWGYMPQIGGIFTPSPSPYAITRRCERREQIGLGLGRSGLLTRPPHACPWRLRQVKRSSCQPLAAPFRKRQKEIFGLSENARLINRSRAGKVWTFDPPPGWCAAAGGISQQNAPAGGWRCRLHLTPLGKPVKQPGTAQRMTRTSSGQEGPNMGGCPGAFHHSTRLSLSTVHRSPYTLFPLHKLAKSRAVNDP
jgi:hypothetical protein